MFFGGPTATLGGLGWVWVDPGVFVLDPWAGIGLVAWSLWPRGHSWWPQTILGGPEPPLVAPWQLWGA